MILYENNLRLDGDLIAYMMHRPEDKTWVYLTQSHSDFLGRLVVMDWCGDFSETLINAIECRELAEALMLFADELDANRDAIIGEDANDGT